MIQQLLEYAHSRGLQIEPGFRPKMVRWGIQVGADGAYQGLVELGNSGQRGNRGLTIQKAPDLQQGELIAGGETRSHFLIEGAAIVALLDPKLRAKHEYFWRMLETAAADVPLMTPIVGLRHTPFQDRLRTDAEENKVPPGDRMTLIVDGTILADTDVWHAWWRQQLRSLRAQKDISLPEKVDLATGMTGVVASTHLKISGLSGVGGAATGDALVSFDKPAFESYGLKQGLNAPMSPLTVTTYRAALDDLIQRGETLGKVRMVYWYRTPVAPEDDVLQHILRGVEVDEGLERLQAEGHAQSAVRSIKTGQQMSYASTNTFYALLLSGVSGRVMVRGWYEETFDDVHAHVTSWFSDLSVTWQGRTYPAPPFWRLLSEFGRPDVPAPLIRALWEVALLGRPMPTQAAVRALARIRANIVRGDTVPHAMYGILRAYVVRDRQVKEAYPMSTQLGLEPNHPSVAYQCGRLLAMLASIQRTASGDVNASVVNRFYGAASTTPTVAFPQLLRLVNHHLAKIDSGPLRQWFSNQVIEITHRIPDFPKSLSLAEQSLFALGYFHQLGTKSTRSETHD